MVTFCADYSLDFPNLSVKKIYTEYFNELEHITVSLGYQPMFERFLKDHDWVGRWDTRFAGQGCVIEFKHFTRAAGERAGILALEDPLPDDAAQVERYAMEMLKAHPGLNLRRYLAYTVGAAEGKLVPVGTQVMQNRASGV